jgi:gliding motility-associated-like protein
MLFLEPLKTAAISPFKKYLFLALICLLAGKQAVAADYYWIGGSGNWSDISHWATTSGGTTTYLQVPTPNDDVHFDANSFTTMGQTVDVNVGNAVCRDLDFTNVTFTPTFSGNNPLRLYGSLKLAAAMNWNYTGTISFEATTTGKIVKTAGHSLKSDTYFKGAGGEWILADDLNTHPFSIELSNGHFNTNGFNVTCSAFHSGFTSNRTITISGSTITAGHGTPAWSVTGTNLTLNAQGSNIIITSEGFKHIGTGKAYHNLSFINTSTWESTSCTYRKVEFANQLYMYPGSRNKADSVILNNGVSSSMAGFRQDTFGVLLVNGAGVLAQGNVMGVAKLSGNTSFKGNNNFDTLAFAAGKVYTLQANSTQTINQQIIATGNCTNTITIESSTAGIQAKFTKTTGTVAFDYVSLKDIDANGGAVFTAQNSTDLGNNSGWTFNSTTSLQLYWVGGNGNWNDPAHWSYSSGGAGGACLPTANDDVHFDANSFTTNGDSVIVSVVNGVCRDMDWTGALPNTKFIGNDPFRIYGSLKLAAGMMWSYQGSINFQANSSGKTITTSGVILQSPLVFNGTGGEWILQDALTSSGSITHYKGHLNTNTKTVTCLQFYTSNSATRTLTISGSLIDLTSINPSWSADGSGLTLNSQGSVIRGNHFVHSGSPKIYNDVILTSTSSFESTGCTFRKIDCTGPLNYYPGQNNLVDSMIFRAGIGFMMNGLRSDSIRVLEVHGEGKIATNCKIGKAIFHDNASFKGSNRFDTLILSPGHLYTLQANATQTIVKELTAQGSCSANITLESATAGTATTISKNNGTLTVHYVSMKDIRAAGGASFVANNSTDLGNNSGWTFNAPTPLQLYWVGGSGTWNDPAHWSLSSGGAGGACIPTASDDVFFDANSFIQQYDSVTVHVSNAACRNMNWTGALHNPIISGTQSMRVYGSLKLSSAMAWALGNTIYMKAATTVQTITTAGVLINSNITFDGPGGEWILQDNLNLQGSLSLINGHFNTNNKKIECGSVSASVAAVNSKLTIKNSEIRTFSWWVDGTTVALDAANSLIKIFGVSFNHTGTGRQYNDLLFEGQGWWSTTSCSYRKVTFTDECIIYNGSRNKADSVILNSGVSMSMPGFLRDTIGVLYVNGYGKIAGNCKIAKAIFLGDAEIRGGNRYDTLILSAGHTYKLQNGNTQTITDSLSMRGNGCFPITLQSLTSGSQATISKASGIVAADFVEMRDQRALGGAQFYAGAYSTSVSNNTGWNFNNGPGYNYGLGPDKSFCNSGTNSITLNTDNFNGGISWLWNTGATTPTLQVSQPGTYWVAVVFGNNCFFADTIQITQTTLPSITATANSPVCIGNMIVLSASGASNYTWTGPNGFTSTTSNPTILNAGINASGTYTVTTTVNGCTSQPIPVTVQVNSPTAAMISISASQTTVCTGTVVHFNATVTNAGNAPAYQWLVNGVNTGISNSSFSTSALLNGDIVSCVLTPSGGNCIDHTPVASNNVVMNVTSLLIPDVSITSSANNVCQGTPISFTATSVNGGSAPVYQWQVNGTNIGGNTPVFTTTALVNGDAVRCTMISNESCSLPAPVQSNPIIMSIQSQATPSIAITASATSICAGTAVTFTANAFNEGPIPTYQWKINGVVAGSNNPGFTTAALNNGDIISCSLTSTAACVISATVNSNTIAVSVTAVSPPSITISGNTGPACQGSIVSFTANASNAGATPIYQWKINNVDAGTNSPVFSSSTLNNGDNITCNVTAGGAVCNTGLSAVSNSLSAIVTTPVTPSVIIVSYPAIVCSGTTTNFTATAANGGISPTYQWQVNGANAGTNSATFTTSTLQPGDIVRCLLTSNAPCTTTGAVPSNDITVPTPLALSPAIVTSSVIATTAITFSWASVTGASTYAVSINGGGFVVPSSGVGGTTHTITALIPGTSVSIIVKAVDNQGCSSSVSSIFTATTALTSIPNSFSPNGDGVNDTWSLPHLSVYPKCLVRIFSRSGEQIFTSHGYQKPWDGTYKGKALPAGTYYYIIYTHENSNPVAGWLQLIK